MSKNPYVLRKEVKSDSGKVYVVSKRQGGEWACSCPGWKFHIPRKDCKHIIQIKEEVKVEAEIQVFLFPCPEGVAAGLLELHNHADKNL